MADAIKNIRDQLQHYADRAVADGENYDYDGWADEHGHLTDEPQDDGFKVQCWWDDQDPGNEGYAYRAARFEGGERMVGQEEGGEL